MKRSSVDRRRRKRRATMEEEKEEHVLSDVSDDGDSDVDENGDTSTRPCVGSGDFVGRIRKRTARVRRYRILKWMCLLIIVSGFSLILFEGHCRRNYPDSRVRPSIFLANVVTQVRATFRWLGWYTGYLLDFYEWIKCLVIDTIAVFQPLWDLMISPIYFIKGLFDYLDVTHYVSGAWLLGVFVISIGFVVLCTTIPDRLSHLLFQRSLDSAFSFNAV